MKNKRSLQLVTSRSSGYKTSSQNFLISYILSDQVSWCKVSCGFWVITKITPANLSKLVHDIIYYSTSICPFESGKCGEGGKKLQNFEYLENKKSSSDEMKTFFIVHEGLSFGKKKKKLIKN